MLKMNMIDIITGIGLIIILVIMIIILMLVSEIRK